MITSSIARRLKLRLRLRLRAAPPADTTRTLFTLGVRVAPGDRALASTEGWVQQCSLLRQFAGPSAVAWVVSPVGGWQSTWLATGASSVLGVVMTAVLMKRLR